MKHNAACVDASGCERSANVVPIDDGIIEGTWWPLVPDGEYVAKVIRHETAIVFKTPKLFIHFELVDPGLQNVHLYAAYRIKRLTGKPGKNGRFVISPRSELLFQLAQLYDRQIRLDRISLRALRNCLLRVRTRTVTNDYRQRSLPEALRYSVVAEVLGIEAGSIKE